LCLCCRAIYKAIYGRAKGSLHVDTSCLCLCCSSQGRVQAHNGGGKRVTFHHPTAIAMAALCAARPDSGPLVKSFIEAGGVAVVTRVLAGSSCPITLTHTVTFILLLLLLNEDRPGGGADQCQELVDRFFLSGGWGPVRSQDLAVRGCQSGGWTPAMWVMQRIIYAYKLQISCVRGRPIVPISLSSPVISLLWFL
jgi:hypothetical protein